MHFATRSVPSQRALPRTLPVSKAPVSLLLHFRPASTLATAPRCMLAVLAIVLLFCQFAWTCWQLSCFSVSLLGRAGNCLAFLSVCLAVLAIVLLFCQFAWPRFDTKPVCERLARQTYLHKDRGGGGV